MTVKALVKTVVKVIAGLVGVTALVYALMPQPLMVELMTVTKADLQVTVDGEGKTRIHDIYVVSTPMDGRITRLNIEPGAQVTAVKTVIANMYPANPGFLNKRLETQAKADVEGARAALALANARVKQAEAQLEYDQQDFQRTEALYRLNNVSEAGLQRAQLRIKTLQAELETAQSNQQVMQSRLESAQAQLLQPDKAANEGTDSDCQICIHSPVDGTVLRILHKSEGIVPVGTPLVEIGDPTDLEVYIEMLSTNAVKIKAGDEAVIKRWGGDEPIKARVRLVEPSGYTKISALGVEEQRVNVILDFVDPIEKWQALGDAYRVEASIIIDSAKQVLTVPLSALFRDNEQWSVFKVVDGVAKLQPVTVARRNETQAEITHGLQVGDSVIVHPGNAVTEGKKVVDRALLNH